MLEKNRGPFIGTYMGLRFFPQDPNEGDITIADISHSLSNQCRFSGHTKEFYSVAQHSVLVSENCPQYPLWGLLHDASEAYLVDIPRPIKPLFSEYGNLELTIQITIARKFGLYPLMIPKAVKDVDNRILMDEAQQLTSLPTSEWTVTFEPLGIELTPWEPEEAKNKFLDRFFDLYCKQGSRS